MKSVAEDGPQCAAVGLKRPSLRLTMVGARCPPGARAPGQRLEVASADRAVRRRVLTVHSSQAPTGLGPSSELEQSSLPPSAADPAADVEAAAPLAVEFHVPHLPLAFGDGVCIVGDLPQLGAWDPRKGLALEWGGGHSWAAKAQLPSGEAAFKVVKVLRGGGVEWEPGSNRTLALPTFPRPLAACGALHISCPYGHASATDVRLAATEEDVQAVAAAAIDSAGNFSEGGEVAEALLQLELGGQAEVAGSQLLLELWQRVHSALEQKQQQKRKQQQHDDQEENDTEQQQEQQGETALAQQLPILMPQQPLLRLPPPKQPQLQLLLPQRGLHASAAPGASQQAEAAEALQLLAEQAAAAAVETEGRARKAEALVEEMAAQLQANAAAEEGALLLGAELEMLRAGAAEAATGASQQAAAQRAEAARLRQQLAAAAGAAGAAGAVAPDALQQQASGQEAAALAVTGEQLVASLEMRAEVQRLSGVLAAREAAAAAAGQREASLRAEAEELAAQVEEVRGAAATSAELSASLRGDREALTAQLAAQLQRATQAAAEAEELQQRAAEAAAAKADAEVTTGRQPLQEDQQQPFEAGPGPDDGIGDAMGAAGGEDAVQEGRVAGLVPLPPDAPARSSTGVEGSVAAAAGGGGAARELAAPRGRRPASLGRRVRELERERDAARQALRVAAAREERQRLQAEAAVAAQNAAAQEAQALGQRVRDLSQDSDALRLRLWAAQGSVAGLEMQLHQAAKQAQQAQQAAGQVEAQLVAEAEEMLHCIKALVAERDAARAQNEEARAQLLARDAACQDLISRLVALEARNAALRQALPKQGAGTQSDSAPKTEAPAGSLASLPTGVATSHASPLPCEPLAPAPAPQHPHSSRLGWAMKASATGVVLLGTLWFGYHLLDLAWSVASHPAPWRTKLGVLFGDAAA